MRILDYHVWIGDGIRPGKVLRWADDVGEIQDEAPLTLVMGQ